MPTNAIALPVGADNTVFGYALDLIPNLLGRSLFCASGGILRSNNLLSSLSKTLWHGYRPTSPRFPAAAALTGSFGLLYARTPNYSECTFALTRAAEQTRRQMYCP